MNTDEVPEAELRDTRDNKTYIVRKLADGKCWMTQNLDLDLSTATPLNSQNTDLNTKTSWVPSHDTENEVTSSNLWSEADGKWYSKSYDLGEVYYIGEEAEQSASSSGPKTAHAGNLYSWGAATADSSILISSFDEHEALDSICPKGWRLPKGQKDNNPADVGEYKLLLDAYNINTESGPDVFDAPLLVSPLSFVRAGWYSTQLTYEGIENQGKIGVAWTRNVYRGGDYDVNGSHANDLYHTKRFVLTDGYSTKSFGHSIRCLAR